MKTLFFSSSVPVKRPDWTSPLVKSDFYSLNTIHGFFFFFLSALLSGPAVGQSTECLEHFTVHCFKF